MSRKRDIRRIARELSDVLAADNDSLLTDSDDPEKVQSTTSTSEIIHQAKRLASSSCKISDKGKRKHKRGLIFIVAACG